MPSRAALQQRKNVASGHCRNHSTRKIFKSGLCEECYSDKTMVRQEKRTHQRIAKCSLCGQPGHYAPSCTANPLGLAGSSKDVPIGEYLKAKRQEHGLSEREASERAGITLVQLRRMENKTPPTALTVFFNAVEGSTGMTVEEFLQSFREYKQVI